MRQDFDLSPHFTFYELTNSTNYPHLVDANRQEALKKLPNLRRTAKKLEEAREILGALHVTSGYRCETLNAAVGGVPNSAHTTGLGVDVTAESGDTPLIMSQKLHDAGFKCKQMLVEPSCLHIGLGASGGNYDMEIAAWENGVKTKLI